MPTRDNRAYSSEYTLEWRDLVKLQGGLEAAPNHLSIAEVAQRWAKESEQGIGWQELLVELIEAYERGELAVAYTLEGRPVDAYDVCWRIQELLEADRSQGYPDLAGTVDGQSLAKKVDRRKLAKKVGCEFRIAPAELARWFGKPSFKDWAKARGLTRPSFVKPWRQTATAGAEKLGQRQLELMMRANPNSPRNTKQKIIEKLVRRNPGLTENQARECWKRAVENTGSNWSQPGRKPSTPLANESQQIACSLIPCEALREAAWRRVTRQPDETPVWE